MQEETSCYLATSIRGSIKAKTQLGISEICGEYECSSTYTGDRQAIDVWSPIRKYTSGFSIVYFVHFCNDDDFIESQTLIQHTYSILADVEVAPEIFIFNIKEGVEKSLNIWGENSNGAVSLEDYYKQVIGEKLTINNCFSEARGVSRVVETLLPTYIKNQNNQAIVSHEEGSIGLLPDNYKNIDGFFSFLEILAT